MLPAQSKEKYERAYSSFVKWMEMKNVKLIDENKMLVYFNELKKKFKPPTLWSHWSMLKTTLKLRKTVDIDKFTNLKQFLKNYSSRYKPKKSEVLSWSNIKQFLEQSNDYIYLGMKVF